MTIEERIRSINHSTTPPTEEDFEPIVQALAVVPEEDLFRYSKALVDVGVPSRGTNGHFHR